MMTRLLVSRLLLVFPLACQTSGKQVSSPSHLQVAKQKHQPDAPLQRRLLLLGDKPVYLWLVPGRQGETPPPTLLEAVLTKDGAKLEDLLQEDQRLTRTRLYSLETETLTLADLHQSKSDSPSRPLFKATIHRGLPSEDCESIFLRGVMIRVKRVVWASQQITPSPRPAYVVFGKGPELFAASLERAVHHLLQIRIETGVSRSQEAELIRSGALLYLDPPTQTEPTNFKGKIKASNRLLRVSGKIISQIYRTDSPRSVKQ